MPDDATIVEMIKRDREDSLAPMSKHSNNGECSSKKTFPSLTLKGLDAIFSESKAAPINGKHIWERNYNALISVYQSCPEEKRNRADHVFWQIQQSLVHQVPKPLDVDLSLYPIDIERKFLLDVDPPIHDKRNKGLKEIAPYDEPPYP